MADRSVADTNTFEVFRTTYNSTATDVVDIGTLAENMGLIFRGFGRGI